MAMKVDPKARQQEREEHGWGEGGEERTPMITTAVTVLVAAVVGFERFESTAKGTPGLKVRFVALDGPEAGKCVDRDYWLTQAAIWQLADVALARGYEEPFDAENDDELAKAIMGKPIEIKTKTRQYTKTKNGASTTVTIAEVDFTNKCKQKAKSTEERDRWKGHLAAAQEGFQKYLDWRDEHPRGGGGGGGGGGGAQSSGGGGGDDDSEIPF